MAKTSNSIIKIYLKRKQLKIESDSKRLMLAHYDKARVNLDFCQRIYEKIPEHPSWTIVSAYYSAYHGALASLAAKNFSSKSHSVTINALKELYPTDKFAALEQLSEIALNDLEILKENRETAHYSINIKFDKIIANEMRLKARTFLLDVKSVLKLG